MGDQLQFPLLKSCGRILLVMNTVLMVGIGGFIGAILRYLVYEGTKLLFPSAQFPIGTLLVNLAGCFAIGLLGYLAETSPAFPPQLRALAIVGMLGAFTTFSTFGNETFKLMADGSSPLAFINISAQVLLGLLAVWAGRGIAAAL